MTYANSEFSLENASNWGIILTNKTIPKHALLVLKNLFSGS
jgi:hypothetical protein